MSCAITDRIDGIRAALLRLRGLEPADLPDRPEIFQALVPLIDALLEHDHDAIVTALWRRKMTDHEKEMTILHNIVYMIVDRPREYGVEKLTKTDILEILRVEYPGTENLIPTSKRGLTDFWSQIGLKLDQGRGAINPKLKKWLDARRAESE